MLHTYRSRKFHRTLNGENPSSSFRDMSSAKCGLHRYQIWQVIGPWASPYGANGQMTLTLHTYRSWQFHRTLNGENLSTGFRDMGSAKCGLHWYQIWQVIGLWASPPGANGQLAMTLHKFRSRQVHRTSNGVNPSNGFRVMGSARSAARPPARIVMTIPLQPGGLRGKKSLQKCQKSQSPILFIYAHI